MSQLLTAENPIIILPSLALEFGIPEAAFLQQVHYWLQKEKAHIHEGRRWVYNSVKDWQAQLYCFSEATINRAIDKLRKMGIVVVDKLAKHKSNRTNYYTLDYSKLSTIAEFANQAVCQNHQIILQKPSDQNDKTDSVILTEPVLSKCTNGYTKTTRENPKNTSKKKPPEFLKNQNPEFTAPKIPIIGTAEPSHPDPTDQELDQLPSSQKDLWRQLRRARLDIAHDDPRLIDWLNHNMVKAITQAVLSAPLTHETIRSLWHTPEQLNLPSSNWRTAA